MKKLLLFIFVLMVCISSFAQPKREFRGAWMQCVNGMYLGKSSEQVRSMLNFQLDKLQEAGINAIMFQVRPEGDALYKSSYEPWSRYLTGTQGVAPADGWDPLQWMIEQCHNRGMECHAWINPYRAKMKSTVLASSHAAARYPERVFQYGDLLIFNPALEVNRKYTCLIVEDILNHYDVDGIHIDDYFYPYPVAGQIIPDRSYYESDRRGFSSIEDWRRDNVNLLIKDLHTVIHKTKPWVKFGVSPFGIYRNSPTGVNSPEGSATNGTTNYYDLYADVVKWVDKGWVDYNIPQIYWNVGTKVADYEVLCKWWNDYCGKRPLFIGQDVERTVAGKDPNNPNAHQMGLKYTIQRSLQNVKGSCQWYAAAVCNNPGDYRTYLKNAFHKYPSLQPEMKFIDNKIPGKVKKLKIELINGEPSITWVTKQTKKEMQKPVQFVIYKFAPGEKINLSDASHIACITRRMSQPTGKLQYSLGKDNLSGYTFVITSLDRLHNESKGVKIRL